MYSSGVWLVSNILRYFLAISDNAAQALSCYKLKVLRHMKHIESNPCM